jgi:hypothetical protein
MTTHRAVKSQWGKQFQDTKKYLFRMQPVNSFKNTN